MPMKTGLLSLLVAVAMTSACTQEEVKPVADFTFGNEIASTFSMGTYDACSLVNRSVNAQSVTWDLGDGRTFTDPNVVLSYQKSGTYSVTLTVTGKDGQQTSISKSVIVKDRVLRSIDISKVYWRLDENGWPPTTKADVYLQIQEYSNAEMTERYLCDDCPVIYTSAVVRDVDHSTLTRFTIPVDEKVIIDKRLLGFAHPENLNNAYLISLMAKDRDGNAYCLQSNRGGGTYFGILAEDFSKNVFIVQNGPFSDYKLVCEFE